MNARSSSGYNHHARAYSQAAGMPFAALVRRLSYTSSRLPAKYSHSHATRQFTPNGYSNSNLSKRPKTSSGPLYTSPPAHASSGFTVLNDGNKREDGKENETPIKVIHSGVSHETFISHEPLSAAHQTPQLQSNRLAQSHPSPSSRPTHRRRSKSGESATSGSMKHSGFLKGKNSKAHRRPNHPLRSISFMDEILLKTPGNKQKDVVVHEAESPHTSEPAQRGSVIPSHIYERQPASASTTPITPDHEIEAALARHDYKRMSMPNLPTPPLTSAHLQPSPAVEARRMSFDAMKRDNASPPIVDETSNSKVSRSKSKGDKGASRPDTAASAASSPGWPWNRRNSNSSITSLLLSPRLFGQRQASPNRLSPSVSPSTTEKVTSPSASTDSGFFRLDRTPSPNLPLRASPLSQQSTPALETDHVSPPSTPNASTPRSTSKSRPGVPKRSLSTSFIMLGRKVASFGNHQAFDTSGNASNSRSGAASLSSSAGSGGATSATASPSPQRSDSGNGRSSVLSAGKNNKRDWPWKHHAQSPASPLSASTPSSPHEEVQWSFKVHGAYPAASPTSPGLSPSSPTVHRQKLSLPNTNSPVYARSPLGMESGETYFAQNATAGGINPSTSPLPNPNSASEGAKDGDAMQTQSEFLSPERALLAERSFVVESRPKLYRGSKSDDGGLAARTTASDALNAVVDYQHLSTSAPNASRQGSSLMAGHGRRSPGRQVSPSPSRNLTKIPEADEHDLQTRRESWLASLRGRPVASKRRMSAADVFGLPSPSRAAQTTPSGLPALNTEEPRPQAQSSPVQAKQGRSKVTETGLDELDFSKKPVPVPSPLGDEDHKKEVGSPLRVHRANSSPATPQAESQALRSRAVSHSSLLSASRPLTPATGSVAPLEGLANIRPFPVVPTSPSPVLDAHAALLQRQPYRFTKSMPVVPQVELASLEVDGLGAPKSSVMSGAQAKFARVLTAAAAQALSLPTTTSTPFTKPKMHSSISEEDKEKMRRALADSGDFEHALDDDGDVPAEKGVDGYANPRDDYSSPNSRRTPKLSYATSSSADSHPSTSELPRTAVRYRILDMGTPIRADSSVQGGTAQLPQADTSHQSSPSNRTSSSISDASRAKNAFDILLSSQGLDSIDGLPQSKVHEWARRDGSDDSAITMSSDGTMNDGRARDVFDEGRVSVW